jgi:hypothetical protein
VKAIKWDLPHDRGLVDFWPSLLSLAFGEMHLTGLVLVLILMSCLIEKVGFDFYLWEELD